MSGGDLGSVVPEEDHGSETLHRYGYQDLLIARLLPVVAHKESAIEAIFAEHVEDIAIDEQGLTRLIQVKTHANDKPAWTLTEVFSSGALGSVWRAIESTRGFDEETEFGIWLSGPIAGGTPKRPELVNVFVAHGDGGYLVSRGAWLERVQEMFDCSPDEANDTIEALIVRVAERVKVKETSDPLTLDQARELVERTWIESQPPLGAMRSAVRDDLSELNEHISAHDFDAHFARIMGRIKDASSAAEGRSFQNSGRPRHRRPDEEDRRNGQTEAKELTRDEILEILQPLVEARDSDGEGSSVGDGIRGLLKPILSAAVLALLTFLLAQFTSVLDDRRTWVTVVSAILAVAGLAVGFLGIVTKSAMWSRQLAVLTLVLLVPAALLFFLGPKHVSMIADTDGQSIAVFSLAGGSDGKLFSRLLAEDLTSELSQTQGWVVWGPDELATSGLDGVATDEIDDDYLRDRGIDIAIYGTLTQNAGSSTKTVALNAWFGHTAVGVAETGIGGEVGLRTRSRNQNVPSIVLGFAPDVTNWVALLNGLSELHNAADLTGVLRAHDFFEQWRSDDAPLTVNEHPNFRLSDFADFMIGTVESFVVAATPANAIDRGTSISSAEDTFHEVAGSGNAVLAIRGRLGLAQVHLLNSPCAIDTAALANVDHPDHSVAVEGMIWVDPHGTAAADADYAIAEEAYESAIAAGTGAQALPDVDFRLKTMKSSIEYCKWKAVPSESTQTSAMAAIDAVIGDYENRSPRDQLRLEFAAAVSYGFRGVIEGDPDDLAHAACKAHEFLQEPWEKALLRLRLRKACGQSPPSVEQLAPA